MMVQVMRPLYAFFNVVNDKEDFRRGKYKEFVFVVMDQLKKKITVIVKKILKYILQPIMKCF